jgi:hypothetical protein
MIFICLAILNCLTTNFHKKYRKKIMILYFIFYMIINYATIQELFTVFPNFILFKKASSSLFIFIFL